MIRNIGGVPVVAAAMLVWLAAKIGIAAGEWLAARSHEALARQVRRAEVVR